MAFASLEFIYGDVPGSKYDLYLAEIGSSSTMEADLGSDYEIISDSTSISNSYVFGMINKKPLEFPMSIMSKAPIDRYKNSLIARTFFNSRQFKKLYIMDDCMFGVYYLCRLNNVKEIKIGNRIYGYKVDVVCDCPYAHENLTKIEANKSSGDLLMSIYNDGDDNDIVYPTIRLYPSKVNGTVEISNMADSTTCRVDNLISGEEIILDSRRRIIKSDRMQLNFDRHNGVFVELLPNSNQLTVKGDINNIKIEYEFLRSVGG